MSIAIGTVVQCSTADWEEGEVTGTEQPWVASGDDSILYEVALLDGRTTYACESQLSVCLGTEAEIAARKAPAHA